MSEQPPAAGSASDDPAPAPDAGPGAAPRAPHPVVTWLRGRLRRLRLAEGTLLALAGVTGTVTGLAAAALVLVVRVVEDVGFGVEVSTLEKFVVPVLGAVVVWVVSRADGRALGNGIVTTMESLALHGGRLSSRLPLLQLVATGAALGTGASGGRESPIVLLGGAVGSTVSRWFSVSPQEVRSMVAAGAAAGIGAAFNAPIGGMLFAIEVIIGGFRSRSLQVIVVSSVAGSVVARTLVGEGIIYAPSQTYRLEDPRELVLYVGLGMLCAVVAAALLAGQQVATRLFQWVRSRTGELGGLVVGALVVGAVAVVVPEAFGDGEELPPIDGIVQPIQAMIDGDFGIGPEAVGVLVVLFVAKLVASLATFGSRTAAGMFAPTLFLGAATGAGVAATAGAIMAAATGEPPPDDAILPGAYALVGMAATYGASARAPLTAILIVFELSGDYELVLPLMLSVSIATFLADRVTPGSIYELPLRDRGIVYREPDDVDLLQTVTVDEVMTATHPVVRPTLDVATLRRRLETDRTHGMAVVSGGRLRGVVTIADLARADALVAEGLRGESQLTVQDIMTSQVVTCAPGEEVFSALRRMAAVDVGRVPVVGEGGRYLGMLRRGDLVEAYGVALARGAGRQHDAARAASLRDLTGVRFLALTVAPESLADDGVVASLPWPTSAILTSVRRGDEIIVPKGDLRLRAGDDVVLLSTHADADAVRSLFEREPTTDA